MHFKLEQLYLFHYKCYNVYVCIQLVIHISVYICLYMPDVNIHFDEK